MILIFINPTVCEYVLFFFWWGVICFYFRGCLVFGYLFTMLRYIAWVVALFFFVVGGCVWECRTVLVVLIYRLGSRRLMPWYRSYGGL